MFRSRDICYNYVDFVVERCAAIDRDRCRFREICCSDFLLVNCWCRCYIYRVIKIYSDILTAHCTFEDVSEAENIVIVYFSTHICITSTQWQTFLMHTVAATQCFQQCKRAPTFCVLYYNKFSISSKPMYAYCIAHSPSATAHFFSV